MEVWADEMVAEGFYRRKDDPIGAYFTLHPWSVKALTRKLRGKKGKGPTGRDTFWLAKLKEDPELIPVRVHMRYIDNEGHRHEEKSTVFLSPTAELRRVKRPPPYQDGYPCWCCVGKDRSEKGGRNGHG